MEAQHPRTRERLLALYEIARGQNATHVAYQSKRNPQTVMDWVHRYNTHGPEALTYQRSGGHPPLCLMRAKVSFYGLYLYNLGQVWIWPFEQANKENTVEVLKRLRAEFPDVPIKLVWDGAPYHRAQVVQETAQTLDISLVRLPAIERQLTCP